MLNRKNRGFILVFVLVIAGILALSIDILYTKNRITHLHFQHEFNEQRARDSALFALNLALARLQEYAGSDDVVSIKSGNFDEQLGLHDEGLKNVVGLWKIVKSGSQDFVKFLCWLTSSLDSTDFDSIKTGSGTDHVCLHKNSRYQLGIPKRRLHLGGNNDEVKWAFIIEDESQKIDLSLVDSQRFQSESLNSQISPNYPNIEPVTTFSAYKQIPNFYQYIDFLEQFSLVDFTLGEQTVNNSDLCTLHSYGIWAKQDGLKQELNFFLNSNKFDADDTVFPSSDDCAVLPPTWKMVQSFVHQTSNIQNNSIKPQPFRPLCRPQYGQNYPLNHQNPDLQPPSQYGIYPLLVQVLFDIVAGADNGELVLKIYPQFVLWNPYDISLQFFDYQVSTNIFSQNKLDRIAITIIRYFKDKPNTSLTQSISLCQDGTIQYLCPFWTTKFSAAFAPGEVKIFSLQNNFDLSENGISSYIRSDYKNCFIVKTGFKLSDFSKFELLLSNQNNNQNRTWNELYFRLNSGNEILQEIAQISLDKNFSTATARTIFTPNDHEKLLLSFSAYLKTALPEDFEGKTGVHWLKFANPRAPYINRALFHDPTSGFFAKNSLPGNWSWHATYWNTRSQINQNQLNFLSNLVLFYIPDTSKGLENIVSLRNINWTPFGYLPAYTLGNSDANPYIPLNDSFIHHEPTGKWPTHAHVEALFDYTYLLNEALFDNFFCAPQNNFRNSIDNQRIKQLYPAENISAENALFKGAFNVHTNSIEPWLAYLSATHTDDHKVIFPRMPANKELSKKFSYDLVKILAQSIVEQILERHYFTSLSAFINRPLNGKIQQHGLIQCAINNVHLNDNAQKNIVKFAKNQTWFIDSAADTFIEFGLPNVVDQADVLQIIANFITTRGDTFKITAYGEYKTDKKVFKKTCEAIVQRMPEFVNPYENSPSDKKLSAINHALGRRFKVILFRWRD